MSLRVQEKFYDVWRALDLVAAMLSIIGLCLAIYAVRLQLGGGYLLTYLNIA